LITVGKETIPHSPEAEAACIGSILLKNNLIDDVFTQIKPDDFFDGRNRIIADIIINRNETHSQEPIDIITLQTLLEKSKKLDSAGGISYINKLIDGVPTTANALHYAQIIKEKSQLRKLIDAGYSIVSYGTSANLNAEDALDKAQTDLFNLSKNRYSDYCTFKSALKDTIDKIEKNYKKKGHIGIPSGYRELDDKISGFHESNLIILGGRPSMGKTALALSLVQNIAINRHEKTGVGIFSLEMTRIEICSRILCAESRIPQDKIRKNAIIESDWPKLLKAMDKLINAPIFIDDTPGLTLHEIMSKARRMYHEGCRIFIIDYLQIMDSSNPNIPREQFIASVSRGLKQLARELAVPIIALTQLNRSSETRTDKRPILSDIRESGSIEQDADIVMFIHRPAYYEPEREEIQNDAELIIAKNRHGQTGPAHLFYDGQFTRFDNKMQIAT